MARVLVTGANGQLGSEIRVLTQQEESFFYTDKENLDICDEAAVLDFVKAHNIEAIINCAAYTAVDKAEEEPEVADKINHLAVRNLAKIAKEQKLKLLHVSTDYVFDGKNYKPYKEEDPTVPTGVYGRSKLAGEEAMLKIAPSNSLIVRTSWVYSSFGANFVKTMLRLGKERESLGVIYDQIGTPTYARDLAQALLEILLKLQNKAPQIYHYSNEGAISWYDFAKEIMKMAKLPCQINPLESFEYPTPAKRPHYSLLNKRKIKEAFGIKIPYWKDSLDSCLRELGERS